MRQVLEALRLTFDQRRSQREVSLALGVSQSTVSEYRRRFAAAGLPWPLPPELDEAALEAQLFPPPPHARVPRPEPDWAGVHRERQRPGMTLQQCWIEYKATEPTGYGFTQFCARYHAWADTLEPVLRKMHVLGEKVFVDYAGQTMPVRDLTTGTVREAQVFVGAVRRRPDRRFRRGPACPLAASGAGLSFLPWAAGARPALSARACQRGLRARPRRGHYRLPLGQVDPRAAAGPPPHHGADGHGEDLARLRPGEQRLPAGAQRPLRPRPPTARGRPGAGAGGRELRQADAHPRPDRPADPR
jgi:hypothetical protein